MAVRRPDRGAVGDAGPSHAPSTDPTDTTTGRSARTRVVATAVLAVVVVACVVTLGVRYVRDTSSDDSALDRAGQVFTGEPGDTEQADREQAMSVASQFILRINTYGPGQLDADNTMPEYADRVRALITPKFQEQFDNQGLPLAEQTVSGAGVGRTSQLFSIGVRDIDDDRATLLGAGSFTTSYPNVQKPKQRVQDAPLPFRWTLDLVKVQGDWLVDDFAPVQSADDENDASTGDEIEGLTDAPSGQSGDRSGDQQGSGQ